MRTGPVGEAQRSVRWVLRHALFKRGVMRAVRAGDLSARLMVEPDLVADPYEAYDALRAQGRIVRTGLVPTTAHHDLTVGILRSPDFGVVGGARGRLPLPLRAALRLGGRGPGGPVDPPSMLAADPPDHTRYRKLVSRAFSAKAVAGLRSRTEEIAAGLLDDLEAKGARGEPVDLVDDYASLLPVTVIAEMLGAPLEARAQLLEWGGAGALSLDAGLPYAQFRRSETAIAEFHDWMLGHFAHVRRHPDGTILSALVHAQSEEGVLTEDELASIAMLLLAAGFETTVNLIGNGVVLLARHPDQLALLREDPSLWPNAVDEVLRHESPVQRTGRIALRDTEVAGERVRQGEIVLMVVGGANRDPAVFADPHRFDVTRPDADRHVAFSSGIHYCLGAGLARMEGEVGLRALFDRFPDLSLDGPPHRRPLRVLRGYDAMPAALRPATVDA